MHAKKVFQADTFNDKAVVIRLNETGRNIAIIDSLLVNSTVDAGRLANLLNYAYAAGLDDARRG